MKRMFSDGWPTICCTADEFPSNLSSLWVKISEEKNWIKQILTSKNISMQNCQLILMQNDEHQILCIPKSVWFKLLNPTTISRKTPRNILKFGEDFQEWLSGSRTAKKKRLWFCWDRNLLGQWLLKWLHLVRSLLARNRIEKNRWFL